MKILRAPGGRLSFYYYKANPTQTLIRVNASHLRDYEDFQEAVVKLSKTLNEPRLPELATFGDITNSSLDDFSLKEIQNMLIEDMQIWEVYLYGDFTIQIHKYPSPRLKYFDPTFAEELTNYFIKNAVV